MKLDISEVKFSKNDARRGLVLPEKLTPRTGRRCRNNGW